MKVAIVGATGMVGTVMLKVLEERNLPITELIPVASARSAGKKLTYKGSDYHGSNFSRCTKNEPRCSIVLCRRRYFIRMGSKICRSGHHRN